MHDHQVPDSKNARRWTDLDARSSCFLARVRGELDINLFPLNCSYKFIPKRYSVANIAESERDDTMLQ